MGDTEVRDAGEGYHAVEENADGEIETSNEPALKTTLLMEIVLLLRDMLILLAAILILLMRILIREAVDSRIEYVPFQYQNPFRS